jgi:peptidoglycan/xylan/chitin deacetylase (PgdA/CDA1 family)
VTAYPLRNRARDLALRVIRSTGGLSVASRSRWRSNRLLILCYHGFAQTDEHHWDPALYVPADHLEARLRFLAERRYTVLPLAEALARLHAGTLPPRTVAITVDDGTYDFHAVAYPIFQRTGTPVTVYVATYHVFDQRPVFDVAFRYLIWKAMRSGPVVVTDPETGTPLSMGNPAEYVSVTDRIYRYVRRAQWSAEQKQSWTAELARVNGLDWEGFLSSRTLGLMRPDEIGRLDRKLVDVQLHTHRHRVPEDRELFLREIRDNRAALARCGIDPGRLVHFCYPSGVHRQSFLPWLHDAGVMSAVTCTPGLAGPGDDPLLLPRFIDAATTSDIEFEGWTSGIRHFLRRRGRAFEVTA